MKQPPKVLLITNGYPNRYKPYAAMYLKRHVQLHREAGLEVTVLAHKDSRQGIFRSSWKYGCLFLQVLWTLVCDDFDLVHAHWVLPSGLFGLFVSRLRCKPFVLTDHGAFNDNFESRPWFIRRLMQLVARGADQIITVGQTQKHNVERIVAVPADRVRCINMGVWLPEKLLDKTKARAQLELSSAIPIVVFIGNLLDCKGPDILMRAAAQLWHEGESFQLFIGGQGKEASNLQYLAATLQVADSITMLGAVPAEQVSVWFTAADICVVPSRMESFGLVAIEAMACSTPVIASDVGGLRETIQDGINGLLFPTEDSMALAERIRGLLHAPALRANLGAKGRQTAMTHNMRLKAAEVAQVYNELLHISPV